MSFDDFDNQKVVLISDEAHHLNVDTKKKMSKEEVENYHSWQSTVEYIFHKNRDNVLLEFTATCDLANQAIKAEYESKIVFNYPLANFYRDRYSKDIITFRSDLPTDTRVLQALILSQYRLKLFQSHRLYIKPVVLFKAAKIADSKEFMSHFIEGVSHLSGADIQQLTQTSHTENIPYALINQLELNVESHSRTLLCTQTTHPKSGQIVQESFQERFDQQDF